jgi:arabinofuranan 3-O-arabinosyltransferase
MQQALSPLRAAEASSGVVRPVWRLRLVAVCLGRTALALLQDPGLTVIDTKVDLPDSRAAEARPLVQGTMLVPCR